MAGRLLPEIVGGIKDASWLSNFTSHYGFATTRSDLMGNGTSTSSHMPNALNINWLFLDCSFVHLQRTIWEEHTRTSLFTRGKLHFQQSLFQRSSVRLM